MTRPSIVSPSDIPYCVPDQPAGIDCQLPIETDFSSGTNRYERVVLPRPQTESGSTHFQNYENSPLKIDAFIYLGSGIGVDSYELHYTIKETGLTSYIQLNLPASEEIFTIATDSSGFNFRFSQNTKKQRQPISYSFDLNADGLLLLPEKLTVFFDGRSEYSFSPYVNTESDPVTLPTKPEPTAIIIEAPGVAISTIRTISQNPSADSSRAYLNDSFRSGYINGTTTGAGKTQDYDVRLLVPTGNTGMREPVDFLLILPVGIAIHNITFDRKKITVAYGQEQELVIKKEDISTLNNDNYLLPVGLRLYNHDGELSVRAEQDTAEPVVAAKSKNRPIDFYVGMNAGFAATTLANGNKLAGPQSGGNLGAFYSATIKNRLKANLGLDLNIGYTGQAENNGTGTQQLFIDENLTVTPSFGNDNTQFGIGGLVGLRQGLPYLPDSSVKVGSEQVKLEELHQQQNLFHYGARASFITNGWEIFAQYQQSLNSYLTGTLTDYDAESITEKRDDNFTLGFNRRF